MFCKFKGCKRIPLLAIQFDTEDSNAPFDEQNISIKSIVKAAVTPLGLEPYDEMVARTLTSNSSFLTNEISQKSRKVKPRAPTMKMV